MRTTKEVMHLLTLPTGRFHAQRCLPVARRRYDRPGRPLHGLVNQEVIKWIFNMLDALGTTKPTKEQIADYVKFYAVFRTEVIPGCSSPSSGNPIPVLSPRSTLPKHISKTISWRWCGRSLTWCLPFFRTWAGQNPCCVDAHSGALLVHYGTRRNTASTLCCLACPVRLASFLPFAGHEVLGFPLERPKSVTTNWVKNFLSGTESGSKGRINHLAV